MKIIEKLKPGGVKHHSLPGRIGIIPLLAGGRRRIAIGVLVIPLVIGALLSSGPGFRIAAKAAVIEAARGAGLRGNLNITGSLWTGFVIRDLVLEGKDTNIRKVTLKEARIDYRFGELVSGFSDFKWLRSAAVDGLFVHLVLPEKKKTAPPGKEKAKAAAEFSPLWNLLSANLKADHVSVIVEKGARTYTVDDLAVALPPGTEKSLTISSLKIPGVPEQEQLVVQIAREDRRITLTPNQRPGSVQVTSLAFAESLPGIFELDADLAISSLDSFLNQFAPELPLDGAVEGRISKLQINRDGNFLSGGLVLETQNATWDGEAIRGMQFTAEVSGINQLQINAAAALSDSNAVSLKGSFDPESLVYDSTGTANLNSDDQLNNLLAFFRAAGKATGKAAVVWAGSGNLKTKQHRGKITINLPAMTLLEGTDLKGAISAEYSETGASFPKISFSSAAVSIDGTAAWAGKRLTIPELRVSDQAGERMRLSAEIPLDKSARQEDTVKVSLEATNLDVASLAAFVLGDPPIQGSLTGSLHSQGLLSQLKTAVRFDFIPVQPTEANAKLAVSFQHTGNPFSPSTWDMSGDALMSGLKWKETDLENLSLQVKTIGEGTGKKAIATLALNQSTAKVEARATVGLSGATEFAALADESIAINGTILVERVEQLIRDFGGTSAGSIPLSGGLSLNLEGLELIEGQFQRGSINIDSSNLSVDGTPLGSLLLRAKVTSPDNLEGVLSLPLDGKSTVEGSGVYDLKNGGYAGKVALSADLKSPGKLHNILAKRNFAGLMPAATSLSWEGRGSVPEKLHLGRFDVKGRELPLTDGAVPLNFHFEGTYNGASAEISRINVTSPVLDLDGSMEWKNKVLRIPRLRGTSAGKEVLALNASMPLDLEKLTPRLWFQQEAALALDLKATALPAGEIARLFNPEASLTTTIDTKISAGGSPRAPELRGTLECSDIVVPREDGNLAAGRLSAELVATGAKAVLKGSYHHPDVEPFALDASLPFHPGAWAAGDRQFSDEPIWASAKMGQSSLAFLATQFPGIEDVSGTVALDVSLSGSVNEPTILGNGTLDVARLRLKNRNAPTFYDIDSAIRFADNAIIVDHLHAIVAGGIVDISGKAYLDGKKSRLDFAIKGQEVLVARTPDWNVRTDVDLTLSGPWQVARLAGDLGITNSRYFKNVDLIPFGLPIRHRSSLPSLGGTTSRSGRIDLDFGIPVEPFKNWPITVHVATKDPFLIRGNLAQSEIVADLVLLGTLGEPVPKGVVKISEGEVTLPFSKLDVEVGKVIFNEQTGFNGALEFRARAKADDYRINIFAYNRLLEPKYVLTSSPPMPPEDIMALLATGTTRDELLGAEAGSVAASKAAMLFLRSMKKSTSRIDREPSFIDQLQDRTELELGKVDPQTGAQTLGGKIQLWKQFFFVGDVDSQSDYRALLKYVFQFR